MYEEQLQCHDARRGAGEREDELERFAVTGS
jgi:hypothetical protein